MRTKRIPDTKTTIKPTFLALALTLSVPACGPDVEDFIEFQGVDKNGKEISFRKHLKRVTCSQERLKAIGRCTSLAGLESTPVPGQLFLGLGIYFVPELMMGPGTYNSHRIEPVTGYAITAPLGDEEVDKERYYVDRPMNEGQVTFTSFATQPGEVFAGSVKDLVLRWDTKEGDGSVLLTIHSGTFQHLLQ